MITTSPCLSGVIPNPSQMAFREDVKHYRDAGILGRQHRKPQRFGDDVHKSIFARAAVVEPERGRRAPFSSTISTRGFLAQAAGPMKKYWDTIFTAWQDTIVTEHEYFVAPAIYTPDVVEKLGTYLREAEASIQQMDARDGHLSRNEQRYLQRMRFMRLG